MSGKWNDVWRSVWAAKWWFLGPVLVLAILMAALVLLGGGTGGQGFNYF